MAVDFKTFISKYIFLHLTSQSEKCFKVLKYSCNANYDLLSTLTFNYA